MFQGIGRENTELSKETDSWVEDLELDLSKSEFLTEIDQNEQLDDLREFPDFIRPRSSKLVKNDA